MKLMWNTDLAAQKYDSVDGVFEIRRTNHPMNGHPVEFNLYENGVVVEKCIRVVPLIAVAERIHNSTTTVPLMDEDFSTTMGKLDMEISDTLG